METPFQHLGPLVREAAALARTRAAADSKTINANLHEIDTKVTLDDTKKMAKEDKAMLRTIHCGGGLGKLELMELGYVQDSVCDYCGYETCDLDHMLWNRPRFHATRKGVDKELAEVDTRLLSRAIKRGVAPAMSCKPGCTYWGLALDLVEGVSETTKKLLGCRDDTQANVWRESEDAQQKKLNARQKMALIKGGYGDGNDPTSPIDVTGTPPNEPNAYIDGGLLCPTMQ